MALPLAAIAAPAGNALASTRSHHHHRTHVTRANTRSFVAEVMRSNAKGLLLRTRSGRVVSFAPHQIREAKLPARTGGRRAHAAGGLTLSTGNVVINVLGLQPGTVVDVTETFAGDGSVTVTITLPPANTSEQASGVITDVETESITLTTSDGVPIMLHMGADQLAQLGLNVCDAAAVTYHADSSVLIADSVTVTGTSSTGDCAPTTDTNGVITQVSDSSVTIDTGAGLATYAVDPSSGLTDGYQVGDLVDVTSTTNADGSLQAVDVQFVEEQVTGTVTSVTTSTNGGSLTIQDGDSGALVTVAADPANGVEIDAHAFNGVSVGDQVTVSYHQSGGSLIADMVCES